MNWDAIGAIGEIIGALAVICSLIYLASQIRVSNKASQQAAMQELLDLTHKFSSQLTESAEMTGIWLAGSLGNELSDIEKFRYRMLLSQLNNIWERTFQLRESQGLEPWIWENMVKNMNNILSSPGFQSWFEEWKPNINENWRNFLEQSISENKNEFSPQGIQSLLNKQSNQES